MNGAIRKRKVKKGPKVKKGKRPKLFSEKSFDSSSEEEITHQFEQSLCLAPSKSETFTFQLKQTNLMPSKSECEVSEISETHESHSDISYLLSNSFDISSDEEISCVNGSVLDQFINCSDADKSAEIVSQECVSPPKKKKLMKRTASASDRNIKIRKSLPVSDKVDIEEHKTRTEKVVPVVGSPLNNFNNEQLYYTSDGIIVVLAKNQKVHFYGICVFSILHGQVEILGHILTKDSPENHLYSLRGSSLLCLQNVTEIDTLAKNYLPNLKLSEKCAIILCKKLQDPRISFIEKHISQQILPREEKNFPRIVFDPQEGSFNLFEVNPLWEKIIGGVNNKTRMMICGGKGVGKTTFLRYAINKLLLKFSEVRVIDLDPGQSEFTIPGCISIIRVTKPIFGVNYTHLQAAERSIISNINIGYEPDKYVASVEQLLRTNLHEVPTLVNYMGYIHGIGINILSAVITHIQPSDIVQIYSQDPKKNYSFILTKSIIEENAKLFVQNFPDLDYTLHQIKAMSDHNSGWTAEPRQLREMCVLAFVHKVIQSDSLFNTTAPLYRINLSDITLCDLKGEHIHPAAINACLVALCAIDDERLKIFKCLGWGIVRGIDVSSNGLVLLTSEKLDILDQVTHLVSGGATLPPSLYMTPDEIVGSVPYVMEGDLVSLGQIPKRSRIPANQRKS